MALKVLGIDYSLNGTGLSIYDGNNIIFKKVFTMVKKNVEEDPNTFIYVPKMEDTMAKIDIVADLIINCSKQYNFVCMEDHIGRYYNWMDGYGVIKYLLRQHKKEYIMVSPTAIKKYAGNGKADKNMMSFFLRNDYNFDFDYIGKLANNIVDASWMAILGYNYKKVCVQKTGYDTPQRTKILQDVHKKQLKGVK